MKCISPILTKIVVVQRAESEEFIQGQIINTLAYILIICFHKKNQLIYTTDPNSYHSIINEVVFAVSNNF